MGLFFNSCDKCGRWIPRSVRFCRYCGGPNDTGWVKCWSCGTAISPASGFCHKCGADQEDQRTAGLVDGRWPRQDEDVALRVETGELKGYLTKGLDVEQGTEAALFQHGRLVGVVGPGRYTADSVMKRVTSLAGKIPTTILLYDASDHEVVLETDGLRTSDGFEVSATYKAVVRLTDAASFVENLLKSKRTLKLPALAGRISDEMRSALKAAVVTRTLDQLFEVPDARAATEQALRAAVDPVAKRFGLTLAQLAFVDFFSPDREAVADKRAGLARAVKEGEVDLERLKLTQRLRRAMTQEKMDSFASEKEFGDFVRQTEHELGLKDVIRADEMADLQAAFSRKRGKEDLLHRIELRKEAKAAEREEAVSDARAEVEARKVRHEADIEEAKQAQDLSRRAMANAREHERELLAIRSKATAEALISIADGPAGEKLARLAELERKQKLSPEQLFAIAAAEDLALAREYARERGLSVREEMLRRTETLRAGDADRMERVMRAAMSEIARAAAGPADAHACPKCAGTVAPAMAYCPHCGKRQR